MEHTSAPVPPLPWPLHAISPITPESVSTGLSVGKKMDKMGLRTAPMAELVLENCRVPATALLGREGRGAEVFSCSMAWERACILATCLGTMRQDAGSFPAHREIGRAHV